MTIYRNDTHNRLPDRKAERLEGILKTIQTLTMCIFIFGMVIIICSCSTQPQLHFGLAHDYTNKSGDDTIAQFRIIKPINGWSYCEYLHISQLFVGTPFNDDRNERKTNAIGCSVHITGE